MPVSKFVCEAAYAPDFASGIASSMDGDVPWDTKKHYLKDATDTITPEKGI